MDSHEGTPAAPRLVANSNERSDAPERPLRNTPDPGRILTKDQLYVLARIPDHRLTLKYIFEEYGVTKRDLLRAYVTGEIEASHEPTSILTQFLELNFPEDIRVAIIREGQEASARASSALSADMKILTTAINDLIAELRVTTAE